MITTKGNLSPESYGLPSEAFLEQLAAQYFVDCDNVAGYDPSANASAYAPATVTGYDPSANTSAYAPATAAGYDPSANASAYAPTTVAGYDPAAQVPATASYNPATYVPTASTFAAQDGVAPYVPTATHGSEEAASYAPRVVSEQQAQKYQAPSKAQAGARPSTSSAYGNQGRDILIGTKTIGQIRDDFPILQETVNGHPLIWMDNGATTQKPQAVIDRLATYYAHENSNVHRGAHELAARATDAYENARQIVADFIGAGSKDDIVFVRGTTEGINLVANAYVKPLLSPGDEIIVSLLEHHANIVPWQLICEETGAVLKVIPVDADGQLILSEYQKLFTPRTKFVSVTQVSNVLGTITPVEELVAIAHSHGVRILVDGAQSVAHIPVNVNAMDVDFFVFSGHKIYAPMGIGALYGKADALEQARPYHGGGNMIKDVTFERTIYNPAPNKFEAGTGSVGDAVGLGEALSYLSAIGMPSIAAYEHELVAYGMQELGKIPGIHMIGTAPEKSSALSFVLDGVPNDEVGNWLNEQGIAVRVGHHCAQPIIRSYGYEGVVRPTLAIYNTFEEIDALVRAVRAIAAR